MKPGLARGLYSTASYLLTPVAFARLGLKSRKNTGYRRHLGERLGYIAAPERRARHVHFHAVSVGETLAAEPMIKKLAVQYPGLSMSVSVTTPTGREQANKRLSDLAHISFLPFDNPDSVKRFLSRIQPDLLVMVETELWPNLIYQCHKDRIPTLVLNARMSDKSAQNYQKFSSLTREMMSQVDLILAQFSQDADRFIQLGAQSESVVTLGNLKFDASLSKDLRQRAADFHKSLGIAERLVWIAASTHPGEEELLLKIHRDLLGQYPDLLMILAPRHPDRRAELEALLNESEMDFSLRSQLRDGGELEKNNSVLLLDTLGELNLFYGLADIAFVGGSLIPHGGHNPIEPALWGVPILTGIHCHNFLEITEQLVESGSLKQCAEQSELLSELLALLESADLRQQMGSASAQVLQKNQGSLDKQKAHIERLLFQ